MSRDTLPCGPRSECRGRAWPAPAHSRTCEVRACWRLRGSLGWELVLQPLHPWLEQYVPVLTSACPWGCEAVSFISSVLSGTARSERKKDKWYHELSPPAFWLVAAGRCPTPPWLVKCSSVKLFEIVLLGWLKCLVCQMHALCSHGIKTD